MTLARPVTEPADSATQRHPAVSVIVMAYNESRSVQAVVEELVATLESAALSHEIIVVDDGSTDGTGAIADALALRLGNLSVIHHRPNRGIGEVYRSGFASARGTHVTFVPADGQFDPAFIPAFVESMSRADLVLGYLPEQGQRRTPVAKLLSGSEKLLYRLMFGRLPRFQGVMMFRREILTQVPLHTTGRGWAILTELIVRATRAGYRPLSVPTPLRERMSGESKVNNLRTIFANVRQAVGLWLSLRR